MSIHTYLFDPIADGGVSENTYTGASAYESVLIGNTQPGDLYYLYNTASLGRNNLFTIDTSTDILSTDKITDIHMIGRYKEGTNPTFCAIRQQISLDGGSSFVTSELLSGDNTWTTWNFDLTSYNYTPDDLLNMQIGCYLRGTATYVAQCSLLRLSVTVDRIDPATTKKIYTIVY